MKRFVGLLIVLMWLGEVQAQTLSGGSLSSCVLESEEMTAVVGEVVALTPTEGSYLDAGFIEILLSEAVDAGEEPTPEPEPEPEPDPEPEEPDPDPEEPENPDPDPEPEEPENPTAVDPIEEEVVVSVRDCDLYVQTPSWQRVEVIALSGHVLYSRWQAGMQRYDGLKSGVYLVRVDGKVFKVMLFH